MKHLAIVWDTGETRIHGPFDDKAAAVAWVSDALEAEEAEHGGVFAVEIDMVFPPRRGD